MEYAVVEFVKGLRLFAQPFTYAICLNELGEKVVHKYIGQEPSGR